MREILVPLIGFVVLNMRERLDVIERAVLPQNLSHRGPPAGERQP